MSGPAVVRICLCLSLVWIVYPAIGVEVDADELARCRAMSAGDQRLACFDGLATAALARAANSTPAGSAPAAPSGAGTPSAPLAASAGGTPSAVSASGAASAPATRAGAPSTASNPTPGSGAAADPNDPANFGLTQHQIKPTASHGPSSVKAIVSTKTEDRYNNVTLLLDNGQTWSLTEPDPRVRPGDTITIERASLGSFLMITPSHRSYRVKRLK
jgi:hypothetical protein